MSVTTQADSSVTPSALPDGEQLSDQFHFKASDQQVDRTVFAQQGRQVNGKADQVGEAGGKGGAGNAPFKGEYEEQVEHDIG